MKSLRIHIAGGSLAGLFAGVLLRKAGHDVTIFERSMSGLAGRGAGLVAQREVFRILREIGCEHVARIGVVAKERIFLDRSGNLVQRQQTPQTQISWDVLYGEVAKRFGQDRYRVGQRIETVRAGSGGPEIVLADGSIEPSDLVIGADGLGSAVRASLFPNRHRNEYAGYVAWRGLIPERDLPQEASELLDRFSFYLAPGTQVLGYLVPGPAGEREVGLRRYNWVWYRQLPREDLPRTFTDRDGRHHSFSLPRGGLGEDRLQLLRRDASALLPPQFAQVVNAENSPSIQGIFDYETPRMVKGAVALIGDAAFVARPHTAMGVSKAAADAAALVRSLKETDDLERALLQYEAQRLPAGQAIAAYGRELGASLSSAAA